MDWKIGVTVDNKLTWSPHLSVKKSFASKLNLLRKSTFLPKSVLENFYLSVILPSVIYSLVSWANYSNSELFRTLENLQSRAARIIYDLKDTSNEDSLKIAKWKTLAYILKEKLFKLMHSAYNGLLPKQLCTSGCRVMHLRGQIILLYLDLHLVIYSNLLFTEGQSSGMQSHRKINSDIASEPRRTISSRLSKIKDFTEFTSKV